jgi:hypothetical protein
VMDSGSASSETPMRLTYREWLDLHLRVHQQSKKFASAADLEDFIAAARKELFSIIPNELGKLFDLWVDAGLTSK